MQVAKKGMVINMSKNDQDNKINDQDKKFEFIKEQVIVKKHKKIKRYLLPLLFNISMAIMFGLIAAVTFCIAEPRLYAILHKEKDDRLPITFPTNYPDDADNEDDIDDEDDNTNLGNDHMGENNGVNVSNNSEDKDIDDIEPYTPPEQVIVEQKIRADMEDYTSMYDEIRRVANSANQSIVRVSSTINRKDWFGNPVNKKVETTGIIIANNGKELLILVSLDRIKGASSIHVVISDTHYLEAKMQDYENDINLAVIAIDLEDIPSVYMNNLKVASLGESYTLALGSPILALGNPNGYPISMEVGVITSKGSSAIITDNKLDLFNTNIMDNEYSDGVIVNMKGEVIGIITRAFKEGVNNDINTNIGISKLKNIIERMVNGKPRIYFGIIAQELTDDAKAQHDLALGIYVNEVEANSPAYKAGIKIGDIITKVNDNIVSSLNSFYNMVSNCEPGDEITVNVKRTSQSTDKELDIKVILEEKGNNKK